MAEASAAPLPIAVDAMGSDHGPQVAVEGAIQAFRQHQISSILVGDRAVLEGQLKSLGGSDLASLLSIEHAADVVGMGDSPGLSTRAKPNSSIRKSFDLVRSGRAGAVVSAGNSGATMAAGMFESGMLPGILRPAIASQVPRPGPLSRLVLLDSGANVQCHAEQLVQFAIMGDYYARAIRLSLRPRIALLSNGSETSKGTDVIRTAYQRLQSLSQLNFVGFVEGHDLSRDVADVVVCDGFVGNVVLKALEGSASMVLESLRASGQENWCSRWGWRLLAPSFRRVSEDQLNPSALGGAPLLGLQSVAVICHGAAPARALSNAIRLAQGLVSEGLVASMAQALRDFQSETA